MTCYLGDPDVDYAKASAAFGVEAETVKEASQLKGAIARAKRRSRTGGLISSTSTPTAMASGRRRPGIRPIRSPMPASGGCNDTSRNFLAQRLRLRSPLRRRPTLRAPCRKAKGVTSSLSPAPSATRSRPFWLAARDRPAGESTFHNMVLRGAQLSPTEAETVIGYLAANFGPGAAPPGKVRSRCRRAPARSWWRPAARSATTSSASRWSNGPRQHWPAIVANIGGTRRACNA